MSPDIDARFTLIDRDGQPHKYEVTYHPSGEGMAISCDLLRLGLPSVLSVTMGDGLDLAGLSEILAKADIPALADKAFAHTLRDGLPLLDPTVRDAAYRGNYPEMWRALKEVVTHNRFLPSLDTFIIPPSEATAT